MAHRFPAHRFPARRASLGETATIDGYVRAKIRSIMLRYESSS